MTLLERIVDEHYLGIARQHPQRQVSEIASLFLETQHRPETYFFELTNDFAIDPHTKRPIESFMDQSEGIGKKEFDAYKHIEQSAIRDANEYHNSWVAIWISPSHPDRSSDTKVIFNYIQKGESNFILVNHALLFTGSPSLSLDIANTILKEQGSLREPFLDREVLRETPLIFRKGVSLPSIYEQIAQLVKSDGLQELRSGKANCAQTEAETWAESYIAHKKGIPSFEIAPVKAIYGASCPPGLMTASEFVIRNGEIWKFVKKCGACGTDINTFISKGYRCKECWNVYLGC